MPILCLIIFAEISAKISLGITWVDNSLSPVFSRIFAEISAKIAMRTRWNFSKNCNEKPELIYYAYLLSYNFRWNFSENCRAKPEMITAYPPILSRSFAEISAKIAERILTWSSLEFLLKFQQNLKVLMEVSNCWYSVF